MGRNWPRRRIGFLFIIERIVEYGDLRDFDWLKENFSCERIRYVLKRNFPVF